MAQRAEFDRKLDLMETACRGYREAVDMVLRHVIDGRGSLRTLIYPMISDWYRFLALRFRVILVASILRDGDASRPLAAQTLRELWEGVRDLVVALSPDAAANGFSKFERHVWAMSSATSSSFVARHDSHFFGLPQVDMTADASAERTRDFVSEVSLMLDHVARQLRHGTQSSIAAQRQGHVVLSTDVAALITQRLDHY